ncbi:MAG: ATP-binding cassette domain-containing protein [Hydrogeniiclostridium mannosilyticum]
MLTVTNLSIRTKQTKETLVRSVSFSVKSGEVLGLIGESGSGKSMTSKCIMRLLNPRLFDLHGSVQWNGKEMLAVKLNELDGYRGKQISMIPQNPMTAFAPMLKLGNRWNWAFR